MWKKFYKKATALALVCAMSVMLTACGDSNSSWKAASSSLENSVEDAIAAGNTEPEASPIDASSLEDCAYALPDPTGEEAKAEQERFHTYLMDIFKESVTSDTVTLHYTVANPAHYDLDVPTATFGDAEISEDAIASDKKETEDEITELQSFDYDLLTGSQKYTYDVIKDYLDLNLESYDYTYLYEPFAYTSGLQTNMPINMSEYKFYNEGDVQDYLALLGQLSDYYGKYLDFEQTKIDKGLFMNEHSASEVVRQCEEFIATPEENLLIATFEDKVRGVEGLSEEQIQDYITQNHDTVINSVIPCYKNVINFFNAHKDDGQNDLGLAGFEHGKEYYAYLLKDKVGTDKTPEEVIDWLDNAIDDVMYEYQQPRLPTILLMSSTLTIPVTAYMRITIRWRRSTTLRMLLPTASLPCLTCITPLKMSMNP